MNQKFFNLYMSMHACISRKQGVKNPCGLLKQQIMYESFSIKSRLTVVRVAWPRKNRRQLPGVFTRMTTLTFYSTQK